jgi:hypothetical protein
LCGDHILDGADIFEAGLAFGVGVVFAGDVLFGGVGEFVESGRLGELYDVLFIVSALLFSFAEGGSARVGTGAGFVVEGGGLDAGSLFPFHAVI